MSPDAQKKELMEQVKGELAQQNMMELISKLNHKCFAACISKPSSSLDSNDSACLNRCIDRYMESWNIVSKVYTKRLQTMPNL